MIGLVETLLDFIFKHLQWNDDDDQDYDDDDKDECTGEDYIVKIIEHV